MLYNKLVKKICQVIFRTIREVVIMFQVGDKIVHPMHGAGVIDSIVTKKVNGVVREYYILKLPVGGMLVMIPTSNSEEIGVRPVVDKDEADRLIASMPDIEVDMTQNWNRRYRENMMRIKSGDLLEVAKVVKGLMLRDVDRGLSTGERKMLHSAKQILISELVLSQNTSYEDVEARINTALA
jgi:CarD family transcriptional regulator